MDKYIGIDLGGSGIRFNDIDIVGKIGKERKAIVSPAMDHKSLTELILRNTEEIVKKIHHEGNNLRGIGFGSPGPLDYKKGVIETPPNLPKINKFPVVTILGELFPEYPIFLVHDADAALIGEQWQGAAKGFNNVAMVTFGTGIGFSVINNGLLIRGKGRASEAGHTDIYAGNEVRPCACGRINHWEPYVSTDGLTTTYCNIFKIKFETLMPEEKYNVSYRLREELTKSQSEKNKSDFRWPELTDKYCAHVVIGLRNILSNFDPECIILGGGIMTGNKPLLNVITDKWNKELFGAEALRVFKDKLAPMAIGTQLRLAELPNAGVVGAAKYVMDQLNPMENA